MVDRTGRLAGKTAFITAAAQGIGRATALAFAAEDARVIATDVNEELLHQIATDRITTARLDVLHTADVERAAEDLGPIDILFNCAGVVHQGTVMDSSEADWSFAYELNVLAMVRTIRAFLPGMIGRGRGSIVNMSSAASSLKGVANRCAYATTKAAVIGLTKSVGIDFIANNIRCNCICPGTIQTPSLDDRIAANAAEAGSLEAARAAFVSRQAMGRLGKPEEIAALALYLAGDESGFLTGQAIMIDGGWSL